MSQPTVTFIPEYLEVADAKAIPKKAEETGNIHRMFSQLKSEKAQPESNEKTKNKNVSVDTHQLGKK